jgi:hypothetical protein
MREAVRHRAIPSAADDVEILPSALGNRAELLGAVALVLYEGDPAFAATAPSGGESAALTPSLR